jgi:hypothetical protein
MEGKKDGGMDGLPRAFQVPYWRFANITRVFGLLCDDAVDLPPPLKDISLESRLSDVLNFEISACDNFQVPNGMWVGVKSRAVK